MSDRVEGANPRIEADSPPSLKYAEGHIDRILRGQKTSTLRLDLEDPPQIGERIHLCDEDGDRFASAVVSDRGYESIEWIVRLGVEGHRDYRSVEECIDELSEYYPDAELTPETCLDIVYWGGLWE